MKSRLLGALFLALLLNSGYISAFATPSIFYVGNVRVQHASVTMIKYKNN